ncbi:hypothetical protein SeMB42_g07719 [Synchytrium endobioticum]|uniref:Uncharacterized protein n=1 Tax=Synchytrium endobioticum TaxID=286115 RepID=A0A507BX27_9FUNG|nr:hypothetical protein SeMB42_g07719 [Synchytrium endobioticum]
MSVHNHSRAALTDHKFARPHERHQSRTPSNESACTMLTQIVIALLSLPLAWHHSLAAPTPPDRPLALVPVDTDVMQAAERTVADLTARPALSDGELGDLTSALSVLEQWYIQDKERTEAAVLVQWAAADPLLAPATDEALLVLADAHWPSVSLSSDDDEQPEHEHEHELLSGPAKLQFARQFHSLMAAIGQAMAAKLHRISRDRDLRLKLEPYLRTIAQLDERLMAVSEFIRYHDESRLVYTEDEDEDEWTGVDALTDKDVPEDHAPVPSDEDGGVDAPLHSAARPRAADPDEADAGVCKRQKHRAHLNAVPVDAHACSHDGTLSGRDHDGMGFTRYLITPDAPRSISGSPDFQGFAPWESSIRSPSSGSPSLPCST